MFLQELSTNEFLFLTALSPGESQLPIPKRCSCRNTRTEIFRSSKAGSRVM